MRGLVLACICAVAFCCAACHGVSEYYKGATGPPDRVELLVNNHYTNTAELRVYLLHNGVVVQYLGIIREQRKRMFIRVQDLKDYTIQVVAYHEWTWESQRLDGIRAGMCMRLSIGQKPMFSALNPCSFKGG